MTVVKRWAEPSAKPISFVDAKFRHLQLMGIAALRPSYAYAQKNVTGVFEIRTV